MYYAVKTGRMPGIYKTWAECEKQTKHFSGAEFKKFDTLEDAQGYIIGIPNDMPLQLSSCNDTDENDSNTLVAYVDGSYEESIGAGGYAAILVCQGKELGSISGKCTKPSSFRNIGGELEGAEKAMDYALVNGYSKIVIYHDYTGIACWANGDWKANNELTQAYINNVAQVKKMIDISFKKVKAHTGDLYNEKADMLANIGAYMDEVETVSMIA